MQRQLRRIQLQVFTLTLSEYVSPNVMFPGARIRIISLIVSGFEYHRFGEPFRSRTLPQNISNDAQAVREAEGVRAL